MATIFQGLAKANDQAIAMQVAYFQSVTIGNTMKPYGQKAGKMAAKAFNWFTKKMDWSAKVEEPTVTELKDIIYNNYISLQNKSRSELDSLLRVELAKDVGMAPSMNDDVISRAMVDEAIKLFKEVEPGLTSSQKADVVVNRFHERIRKNLNKMLENQDPETASRMEQAMDNDIQKMSQKERDQIREALRIDELSGKTMRNTLVRAGLPALALGTTSGLGIFVATTTIMHALFTTILGITLPFAAYTGAMSFLGILTGPVGWAAIAGIAIWQIASGSNKIDREMLAQCIYVSAMNYGHSFAPLQEELAAWKCGNSAKRQPVLELGNYINALKNENPNYVSEAELHRQLREMKDMMSDEYERAVARIEEEFEEKKQEILSSSKNRENDIERLLDEKNELIESMQLEHEEKFAELTRQYKEELKKKNAEIMDLRGKQDSLIAELEHSSRNEILRNEQVKKILHEAINMAETEINIMSPWMTHKVVNGDLIQEFWDAIDRGVTIKIRYGIGQMGSKKEESRDEESEEVAQKLRKEFAGKSLILKRGNEHSKLFICDEKFYVITSYNPLSFGGNYSWRGQRGEIGEKSTNIDNLMQYRSTWFNFW